MMQDKEKSGICYETMDYITTAFLMTIIHSHGDENNDLLVNSYDELLYDNDYDENYCKLGWW